MNHPTTQGPEEKRVYKVPEGNVERLLSKFNALVRRAQKLGCAAPVLTQVGTAEEPETRPVPGVFPIVRKPTGRIFRFRLYEVSGEAPRFAGWVLAGSLDIIEGAGAILRMAPGEVTPDSIRHLKEGRCDHCHTTRDRKAHHVVRHEATGEFKVVGSSCIKDFLGHAAPDSVVAMAELLSSLDDLMSEASGESFGGGGGTDLISLEAFLSYVAAAIEAFGWVSRGQAMADERSGAPTCSVAMNHMFPSKELAASSDHLVPTEEHRALVAKAIAWAAALPETRGDRLSDFDHNLALLAATSALPLRATGIAAAMIFCYRREVERVILREKKARFYANSAYVGEVGKRQDFQVTVVNVYERAGDWGLTLIFKLVDLQGNLFTWFCSKAIDLEQGKTYVLKGTVKAHEEYKGTKQTIITRCKLLGEIETPAPAPAEAQANG